MPSTLHATCLHKIDNDKTEKKNYASDLLNIYIENQDKTRNPGVTSAYPSPIPDMDQHLSAKRTVTLGMTSACPSSIPDMDQYLKDPQFMAPDPGLLVAPASNDPGPYVDFTELPLDERFVSRTKPEKKSIIHLQAIERQKELIGKLSPVGLESYLPPVQSAPSDEYAIASPPRYFVQLIKITLDQPSVRKEAPL